jgi:hypothetical protein
MPTSFIGIEPYADLDEAEEYFNTRPNSEDWFDLTSAEQLKYLITATRYIDRLRFAGCKTDPEQIYAFPRSPDLTVPDAIKIATCEIAINLADETNMEQEIENLAVVNQTYGSVRTQYHEGIVVEHIRAGIPSAIAWSYLKPFLVDPTKITVIRG